MNKVTSLLSILVMCLMFGCTAQQIGPANTATQVPGSTDATGPITTFNAYKQTYLNKDYRSLSSYWYFEGGITNDTRDVRYQIANTPLSQVEHMVPIEAHVKGNLAYITVNYTSALTLNQSSLMDFDIPLQFVEGKWMLSNYIKTQCSDSNKCYYFDNSCYSGIWVDLHNVTRSTTTSQQNLVCDCSDRGGCNMVDLTLVGCTQGDKCYYHTYYDACYNEQGGKEKGADFFNGSTSSVECICKDNICHKK